MRSINTFFKCFSVFALMVFTSLVFPNDCTWPNEFDESHYLGYQAVVERENKPLLMWWKKEYDDREFEPNPRHIGLEILSGKRIFKEAKEILKVKKADTYLLAWSDDIYINDKKVEVIKVSAAYSNKLSAYDVAYETVSQKREGSDKFVSSTVKYVLGCSANLLE